MTSNTETVVNPVDTPVDPTTRESITIEENQTLRHVMAQLWQAWANGQEPPTSILGFPEITSIRSSSSQVPISDPFFPPGYGPFDNCGAGPSTTRPQGMPFRNNPTVATAAPIYTLLQPTMMQRAAQEGRFIIGVIGSIPPHRLNPTAPGFQANERCEYHSGAPGHSTDNCWTLKGAIEKLIDHGVVVVTDDQNTPNVTNNPLPAQKNLVGMICDDQEYKLLGKMGKLFRKIGKENKPIKSLEPVASLSVEGVNLDTKVLCIPGVSKGIEVRACMPKLYVSRGFSLTQQDQNCLAKLKGPIFVKPVQQLSVTDSKAVPWNYNKIDVVYRGKENVEEVDEAGGLTRSGRYDLPIYRDPSIPYIKEKEGCDSIAYQSFEAVSVDRFKEGDPIIQPCLSSFSLMVATTMLKYGYQPGKGLGLCSQGIVDPITLLGNQGTSGLGFKQSKRNGDETKNHKRTDWALPQPIPHIYHSFIKPQGPEMEASFTHEDIEEVIQDLSQLFCEVNMVQVGEGTSHADVQLVGSGFELNNWEATPFPIRKESW
ncbi:hypothetical protein H5410_036803 [Solanum commersonii]|uniref:G-patch domain-containing protein n=1 Tax=Solanum commersonii TaxID=4109 RepID=A0A9J5Y4I9_SOLCO|nr:hypothetical protein H5410_036803 [Solanum commersonii]